MMDRAAIERALGMQSHDLARKVMPVRGRHQAEAVGRAARMGRNQAALLGLATELPYANVTTTDTTPDEAGVWQDADDVPDAMDVAAGLYAQ